MKKSSVIALVPFFTFLLFSYNKWGWQLFIDVSILYVIAVTFLIPLAMNETVYFFGGFEIPRNSGIFLLILRIVFIIIYIIGIILILFYKEY